MKKKLVIILLALAAIGGGLLVMNAMSDDTPTDTSQLTSAQLDEMNADDATATTEKDQAADESNTPSDEATNEDIPPDTSNKQSVTVTITEASSSDPSYPDMVLVRAYANSVLEDGSCTASFTKSGQTTKTYTENTEQQTSYTQCNPFQIPQADFSSGTWQVTVTFDSTNYHGEASTEVNI